MTLDELRSLLQQIQNDATQVSNDQLDDAVTAIREQVAEARKADKTPELVANLEALQSVRDAVAAEQTGRADAAAAQTAEAERLLNSLDTPEVEPVADSTDGEPAVDAPSETEDVVSETPELAAVAASAIADAVAAGITAAFAAQAGTPEATSVKPEGRAARRIGAHAPAAVVASAGDVAVAKVYAGSNSELGRPLENTLDVAKAFHDKLRGAYQAKGSRGRMPVISVAVDYPESRVLGSDTEANFEKIQAVTQRTSLVAAGGLCAPLETDYSIDVIGSADRPLRDALARFATERGGIQYRPNTSAAAALNGVGVWTMANDEDVDTESDAATKACYVVDCPDLETATVQAIYSCLEFGNISTRFDPETTASNVEQGLIAHARLAENELYKAIAAGSKLIYGAQQIGATRDILGYLDRVLAYYRNRHRLTTNTPLTQVLPSWVKELVRADLARQLPAGDWMAALSVTDAQVDGFFATRNVSPVWFLDGSVASATVNSQVIPRQTYDNVAAGSVIPIFPAKIDSLLFTTGSWLFLDGGSLDLGLVRDSELNSRNRYRQFSETFEGVADRGIESLRVLMPVKAIGTAAGSEDLSALQD